MKKRFFALLIAVICFNLYTGIGAEDIPVLKSGRVKVIIELEGQPVLEEQLSAKRGAFGSQDIEKQIDTEQETVKNIIENSLDEQLEIGYKYTNVMNGFSTEIYSSDIERIKKIPGVKNVYRSITFGAPEAIEPTLADSGELIGSGGIIGSMNGYSGEGRIIAVVDTGIQADHPFFALTDPSTAALKQVDIQTILSEKFSGRGMTSAVYKSPKIPFFYNYKASSDTNMGTNTSHGTHVSGIAAGNSVNIPETFSGIAPEAQIAFFNVFGNTSDAESYDIIAAIDDAVKLGVTAINLSLGAPYLSEDSSIDIGFSEIFDRVRKAGIMVCAAAGNYKAGYNFADIPITNTEYMAGGSPGNSFESTTVGSVNKKNAQNNVVISDFSGYNFSEALEMRVSVTAPGGSIISSIPGSTFGSKSGTSMSAPQISGVSALLAEYAETNFPTSAAEIFDELPANQAKTYFMESLLMSTADPTKDSSGILYSPRQQGAGMVNLDGLVNTTAILYSENDYKTRINLGGDIGNEFSLDFTVYNFGDEEIEFSDAKVDLIIDDYKVVGNNKYLASSGRVTGISGSKKIISDNYDFSFLPVTVAQGSSEQVSIDVTIDEQFLLDNKEIFVNGFFIDGFLSLISDEHPDIGMPFMGFYGDWGAAPVFDKSYYQGGYQIKGTGLTTYLKNKFGFLGVSISGTRKSEQYISVSPNGDNNCDYMMFSGMPLRSVRDIRYSISSQSLGEISSGSINYDGFPIDKYYDYEAPIPFNFANLLDGEYEIRFETIGNGSDSISFPFSVDRAAPEIFSILRYENEGQTYLRVKARDDNLIDSFMLSICEGAEVIEQYVDAVYDSLGNYYYAEILIGGKNVTSVSAIDFARNSSCVETGDFEFTTEIVSIYNNVMVVKIMNLTAGGVSGTMIPAVYSDNGKRLSWLDAKNLSVTFLPGEIAEKTFTIESGTGFDYKIFIWNNLNGMIPLAAAGSYN